MVNFDRSLSRHIQEINLRALLDNNYLIPIYQRRFAWEKSDWEKILEDIRIAGKTGNKHYMSSILSKYYESTTGFNVVVDGQQRITTLTLLYKVIWNYFESEILKQEETLTDEQQNKLNSILNNINQELIYKRIRENQYIPKLTIQTINNTSTDHSLSKILEDTELDSNEKKTLVSQCYSFFQNAIQTELYGKTIEEKINIFYIYSEAVECLTFIKIPIHSQESPQEIFESINSLGKKLVPTEIIKNALLMRLKEDSDAERIYKDHLLNLDSPIYTKNAKAKDAGTYVLYQWIRGTGRYLNVSPKSLKEMREKDSSTIVTAYNDLITTLLSQTKEELSEKTIEQLSKYLGDAFKLNMYLTAKDEADLRYGDLEKLNGKDTSKLALNRITLFYERIILGTKATQNWSLLYLLYHLKQNTGLEYKEWSELLDFLESYIARAIFLKQINFGQENVNRIIGIIIESLKEKNKSEENQTLKTILKNRFLYDPDIKSHAKRWVTNEEIFAVTVNSSLPHSLEHAKTQYAKMLLTELHNKEQESQTLKVIKEHLKANDYSHEHWMPQASDNSWLKDNTRKIEYCWSLGNHALIPQSLNSKLGNKDLKSKVKIVKDHIGNPKTTGIKSFDEIILPLLSSQAPVWDEIAIKERETRLVKEIFTNVFKDINEI